MRQSVRAATRAAGEKTRKYAFRMKATAIAYPHLRRLQAHLQRFCSRVAETATTRADAMRNANLYPIDDPDEKRQPCSGTHEFLTQWFRVAFPAGAGAWLGRLDSLCRGCALGLGRAGNRRRANRTDHSACICRMHPVFRRRTALVRSKPRRFRYPSDFRHFGCTGMEIGMGRDAVAVGVACVGRPGAAQPRSLARGGLAGCACIRLGHRITLGLESGIPISTHTTYRGSQYHAAGIYANDACRLRPTAVAERSIFWYFSQTKASLDLKIGYLRYT